MNDILLKMDGISKTFPGVKALDNVHIEIRKGEVHALLGENGAGKSTLLKILSGAYTKDAGRIEFDGKVIDYMDAKIAEDLGIAVIYQEFSTLPHLSIAENIFLAQQPRGRFGFIDWKKCNDESRELLKRVGLDIDPSIPIRELKVAQQQMVEIAKALSKKANLIVMDEPTAPLTQREINNLFAVIHDLKEQGVSIIYVSHRLVEIKQICDRMTILRDGTFVDQRNVCDTSFDEMIRLMVGRELSEMYPKAEVAIGDEVLSVRHLSTKTKLKDINFTLRRGEILGISGLVGSGRTELARAIFGADPISEGEVFVLGNKVENIEISKMISLGVGLVPEDRKKQGLVLMMNVCNNISLSSLNLFSHTGKLNLSEEINAAEKFVEKLHIVTPGVFQETNNLSGGNQQKVVLSKWLCAKCRILIIDEPTRGIDVGAKKEIYELMGELVKSGIAIAMISSELPELIGVCDRIVVMHEGSVSGEIDRKDFSEEIIMKYATGHSGYTETEREM